MGVAAESSHDDDMEMIDSYLEYLAKRKCSADTIKLRRKILSVLHRSLMLGVGYTSRIELETWLHGHKSPNTLATYWVALKSFYGWASDPRDPWITEDPTVDMIPVQFMPGEARPAKEEHLAVILDRAVEPFRTWVIIAAYQGLRCCEIAGLERQHITRDTLLVVRGKGGKARRHDTDPLVWEVVRALPVGPVARNQRTGEQATATYVSKRTNYYLEHQLGLAGVTMHMFRHRLGVEVQRRYKNIRVTQEMLGHAWVTSTQIYTAADRDEMRAARAMLPRPAAAPA